MKKFLLFSKNSACQSLAYTVLLIPLWWILGIKFIIFHLAVFWATIKLLKTKKEEREALFFPPENFFLLSFILIYLFSFILNYKDMALPRAIASLNNLSLWVMGWLIIFILYNSNIAREISNVLRTSTMFGIISGLFVITAYGLWLFNHKYIRIESIFYKLLPHQWLQPILNKAPLLKSSFLLNIIGVDKLFQKPFPRSPGFNVYATALGATMLFLIALSLTYFKVKTKKKNKWLVGPVLFLEISALILSLSRISVIAFILSALLMYSLVYFKKFSYRLIMALFLICLIFILTLIPPSKIIQTASSFRKNSTAWRLNLYKMTLTQSLKKPILGHGYKPQPEGVPTPIGSHSTYLGVFYKTGFLGFLAFVLFWINIFRRWWKHRTAIAGHKLLFPLWFYGGLALGGGLFWMISEDLDAPPIVAFIYFIIVGLVISLNKMKIGQEK